MITEGGLEGGAIYALSASLRPAIDDTGSATLTIDLRPGLSTDDLIRRLDTPRGNQSTSTYLRKAAGLSPLAIGLMRESLGGAALPQNRTALATFIKSIEIKVSAAAPLARAISSAGGIKRSEVDTSFMLKKKPGVFAIGEMLDWEAPTGGYLLQANLSTAYAAAEGIERYLKAMS
jgi:predicted flavoprotein YhiN